MKQDAEEQSLLQINTSFKPNQKNPQPCQTPQNVLKQILESDELPNDQASSGNANQIPQNKDQTTSQPQKKNIFSKHNKKTPSDEASLGNSSDDQKHNLQKCESNK